MSEEKEKCIEVKFDSTKEKVFIFLRSNTTMKVYNEMFKLMKLANEHNIYLLPTDIVESVKVIKDVKE